jgi:hypothetical protein
LRAGFRIKFDSGITPFIFIQTMAEIPSPNLPPTPTGAVPPPKKETGKVQPKKETVRINLPPKPTAAPTIKLPTLPPGGPTGAPSQAPALATAAPALRTAAAPAATPPPARGGTAAAPTAQQRPTSTSAPRSAAPAGAPTIKGLDKILIFTAAVASLAAVGGVLWVFLTLKNTIEAFNS